MKRVWYIQSGMIPMLQSYYSGYMPLDDSEIKILKWAVEEIKHEIVPENLSGQDSIH